MKYGVTIYEATEADAALVAQDIRREDRIETLSWTMNGPETEVPMSVRASDVAYAVYAEDGAILGVCGGKVENIIDRTGLIWALTTNAVNTHKRAFVKGSKYVLDSIMSKLPGVQVLHNWVSNEYEGAKRWLEWMGAGLSMDGFRRGFDGTLFREFYIINPFYREEEPCA